MSGKRIRNCVSLVGCWILIIGTTAAIYILRTKFKVYNVCMKGSDKMIYIIYIRL